MKHTKFSPATTGKSACSAPSTSTAAPAKNAAEFVPFTDEIARRAYFNYENGGSQPGHDVQHWLKAESDLLAERNTTREHGYHHAT
jgi:hypothetical protein